MDEARLKALGTLFSKMVEFATITTELTVSINNMGELSDGFGKLLIDPKLVTTAPLTRINELSKIVGEVSESNASIKREIDQLVSTYRKGINLR